MLELIAFYKSASDYFSIQLFTLEVICPKLEIRFELSYYVFIHSKQVCCLNQKEIILLLVKKIFFQRTSTRLPSTKVGSAAAGRDDKKVEKYSNLSDNYHFVPVRVETFSAYDPQGNKLVKEIGKKNQEANSEKLSTFFLFKNISMAIQQQHTLPQK